MGLKYLKIIAVIKVCLILKGPELGGLKLNSFGNLKRCCEKVRQFLYTSGSS